MKCDKVATLARQPEHGRAGVAWHEDLTAAMANQGLSASQLATRMGVDRSTVYRWMNGAVRPEVEHAEELALVVKLNPTKFILSIAREGLPGKLAKGRTKAERITDLERRIAEQSQLLEELRHQPSARRVATPPRGCPRRGPARPHLGRVGPPRCSSGCPSRVWSRQGLLVRW